MKRTKIIYAVLLAVAFIMGIFTEQKRRAEKLLLLIETNRKNALAIKMYDLLIQQMQRNRSLGTFFDRNGMKRIAVYGMNDLSKRVVDELQRAGISVEYAIDRRAKSISADIEVVLPDDDLKEVDAIVVVPVFYYDEIEEQLRSRVRCPIISLEDVIENS